MVLSDGLQIVKTVDSSLMVNCRAKISGFANILLSPNPNYEQFEMDIQSKLPEDEKKIKIIDLAGNIVYDNVLADVENYREFDLSATVPGT